MRPIEEYERRLSDEHVLLDPVRSLAALIVLQQARVQRAVDLEQRLQGVVLPLVGQEIERLAKLWGRYQDALDRLGIGRSYGPAPTVDHVGDVNAHVLMQQQIQAMPEELRAKYAEVLREAREAAQRERMGKVDAQAQGAAAEAHAERQ